MGLCNELSCETGNFSRYYNPHRFLQPGVLRLYFLVLEPWVAWSVSLPSCSFWFIHTQMWDCLVHQLPRLPSLLPCHASSPVRLPISAPPTSLDECFFFNSLVVGLPYSLIFLAVLVVFCFQICWCPSWLYKEAQCVYLRLHFGWKYL